MILLYTWVFRLLLPLIFLRLYWRSCKNPEYRRRIRERLGRNAIVPQAVDLWVHAVSLGESVAATAFIKAFQAQHPQSVVLVTNITPAGSMYIQKTFGDQVLNTYLPYDLPEFIQPFLQKFKPRLGVILETELWPNLLALCGQAGIPLLLANACVSENSFKKYLKIKNIMGKMFQNINVVAAQTRVDAQRFEQLGVPREKIIMAGGLKFDMTLPPDLTDKAAEVRQILGAQRLVWVAGSTHEGEEEIILQAFAQVRKLFPTLLLVIAPRKPERFAKVAALCRKEYAVVLRSEHKACTDSTEIFVADSLGELLVFYAAADVALVAGSFTSVGGHNLLEPAAIGIPVLVGPDTVNITEVVQLLIDKQALLQVNTADELANALKTVLDDEALRQQMGMNARQAVAENRGALRKQLAIAEQLYAREFVGLEDY